jgi:hypothetical protein
VRQVEDRLRAEYVSLLPSLQRTLTALETEINYLLLPAKLQLDRYARIEVRGRVKECESAVDSLRRRQEGGAFDSGQPEKYSLTALPDLVGLRVLTFPHSCFQRAEEIVVSRVSEWTPDPIPAENPTEPPIALKFHGSWNRNDVFSSEIQVVSLLIGLFWEVEHSAIYKPAPNLRGVAKSIAMKARISAVLVSLREFENEFTRQIESSRNE